MSLTVLALGTLTSDPQERTGGSGKTFVVANLRTATEADAVFVSVVAFSESAMSALLALKKGDSASVTGRAKLTSWTTRDGIEKHGLSITADGVLTPYAVGNRRDVTTAARQPDSESGAPSPLHA
jgi:single-stranded DNA-binding protein